MHLIALLVCSIVSLCTDIVIASPRDRGRKGCANVKTCLEPFPMLVDLIEKDKSGALATLTYGVLLDSVCSKQPELNACLSRYTCNVFEKSYVVKAVNNTLEFICGEGREVLVSEAGCFSRDDFEWGTYQCSRAMRLETDIATLQSQASSNQTHPEKSAKTSKEAFCKVFENLLRCIHINVERTCSTKAANFTRSVFGRTVKPFIKKLGCSLK